MQKKTSIFFFSFGCPNLRGGGWGSTWLGQKTKFFDRSNLRAPLTFRTSLPAFGCAGHEGGWEPLWANWKLTDLEQKVEWEADLSPFYSDKFLLRSHGEQRVSQLEMREYPRGGGLEISPDHQYHNWLEIHPGMGPRAAGLQPPLGMGFSAGKRKEDQIQQAQVVKKVVKKV